MNKAITSSPSAIMTKLLEIEAKLDAVLDGVQPAPPPPGRKRKSPSQAEYIQALAQVMKPGRHMHYTAIHQALSDGDLLPNMMKELSLGNMLRVLSLRGDTPIVRHRDGQYIFNHEVSASGEQEEVA